MKAILSSMIILMSFSAFAGATTNLSAKVKTSNIIACSSHEIGNFVLHGLNTDTPVFIRSSTKKIQVTKRTAKELSFKLTELDGYRYKLTFGAEVQHQDVDNSMYNTIRAVLSTSLSDDTYTAECNAQ